MDVQAGTGWHVSELVRFARMGSVEPYRGEAKGIAGVLVCPQTKSGEPLRTAVSAEVLEAGKRLVERGSFSFEKYTLAIEGACEAAGIPPFTPGRFRHSVATWAIEKGADPAARVLGPQLRHRGGCGDHGLGVRSPRLDGGTPLHRSGEYAIPAGGPPVGSLLLGPGKLPPPHDTTPMDTGARTATPGGLQRKKASSP